MDENDLQILARKLRYSIEAAFGGYLSVEVARRLECELKGLVKHVYQGEDKALGHHRIEKQMRNEAMMRIGR